MKCKECPSCRKGWFEHKPKAYVCIGVKWPFVIDNIDRECTEYPTAKIAQPEPVKSYVDDNGIWIPSVTNPRCHQVLISKELFVEAYNKWIKKYEPKTLDDCEWMND